MKKNIIISIAVLLIVTVAIASTIRIQTNKTFISTTNRTDTSLSVSIKDAANVDYTCFLVGSSTSTMTIAVDGLVGTQWRQLYTSGATASFSQKSATLRNKDTNYLAGVEQIRFRNTIKCGDSTSATSYSLQLGTR